MSLSNHASSIGALRTMMLIRAFEAALARRRDHGFQLLSAGEEAVAVGLCGALTEDDQLLSSGRSIGPALARGLDPAHVMAELLGKTTGYNKGKGGRGHLAAPHKASSAPMPSSRAISASPPVLLCHAKWPVRRASSRSSSVMALAVPAPCMKVSTSRRSGSFLCFLSATIISSQCRRRAAPPLPQAAFRPGARVWHAIAYRRRHGFFRGFTSRRRGRRRNPAGQGPAFLECLSERFGSHSTTARETRSQAELSAMRLRCPIARYGASLSTVGLLDDSGLAELEGKSPPSSQERFTLPMRQQCRMQRRR